MNQMNQVPMMGDMNYGMMGQNVNMHQNMNMHQNQTHINHQNPNTPDFMMDVPDFSSFEPMDQYGQQDYNMMGMGYDMGMMQGQFEPGMQNMHMQNTG